MNKKNIFLCAMAFLTSIRGPIPDGEYHLRELIDDLPPRKLIQGECSIISMSAGSRVVSMPDLQRCLRSQGRFLDFLTQSFGAEKIDPTAVPVLLKGKTIITKLNFADKVTPGSELSLVLNQSDFIVKPCKGKSTPMSVLFTNKPNVDFMIYVIEDDSYILSGCIPSRNYMFEDFMREIDMYMQKRKYSNQEKAMHIGVSHGGFAVHYVHVPLTAENLRILLGIPYATSLEDISRVVFAGQNDDDL